jgi:hypothetical protein
MIIPNGCVLRWCDHGLVTAWQDFEKAHTHLNEKATMLVVEWWTPADGLRRIERE